MRFQLFRQEIGKFAFYTYTLIRVMLSDKAKKQIFFPVLLQVQEEQHITMCMQRFIFVSK